MRASVSWLGLAIFAVAGCQSGTVERPAPKVVIESVKLAIENRRSLSGEVRSRTDSTLAFRVGGQIVERLVNRGQFVRRGQPLARIDPADLRLGVAEARAQSDAAAQAVTAARSLADRAAADERRLRPLVGIGGISAQQYDAARAGSEAAAAELAAARARLAASQTGVGRAANQARYGTLVADADGVVIDLLAEPGQVVAAGQSIVRLARSGDRDALVAVPEALRAGLPRTATVVVYEGGRFPAMLREVAGGADPITRTFEARFEIIGGANLPVGSSVSLLFQGDDATPSLAVPLGALIDRGKGSAVWVVGRDMKVALRPVTVASIQDDHAVLSGGLRPGERVVALGAHLLSAGQTVRAGALPR